LNGLNIWKPDRFIVKKIFSFIMKRSRLVPTIWKPDYLSGFQMVQFSDARDWHKIQSEYRPRFGIRWVTVQGTPEKRRQYCGIQMVNLCTDFKRYR
jgi:hypothetical protein